MEAGKKWDLISIASIPLIMTLGNSMLMPILPAIRDKLGITSFQTSLMITVYSAVAIVLIPIAGFMSDRYGRKKVIIPSLIIAGVGGLVSGLAAWWMEHSYWLILLGRFLQGIGAAGAAPIVLPLVGDIFKRESDVSSGLGIVETSNTFGKVLSPILGSALAMIVWFLPFLMIPVFCLISVLLVAFLVKPPKAESKSERGPKSKSEAASVTKATIGTSSESSAAEPRRVSSAPAFIGKGIPPTHLEEDRKEPESVDKSADKKVMTLAQFAASIKQIFKQEGRWLYAIFTIGCICMFVIFGVLFYLSDTLEKEYGIDGIIKGCVLAIPLAALCAASYVTGKKIDKNKIIMKWVTVSGIMLLAVTVFLCGMMHSMVVLIGLLCLAGIGIGVSLPCLDALITEGIDKEQRGTITSIYSSMRFIGVAAGPPVVSLLLKSSDHIMFYSISGTCVVAALLALWAIKPSKENAKQRRTGSPSPAR